MAALPAPGPEPGWRSSRLLSAAELLLGAAVVLGHNVWKVLPNEVPILLVLGLLSCRLRRGGLAALGFRRPASWGRVVAIALGAAALRLALGGLVVEPLAAKVWPPIVAPAGSGSIAGNPGQALLWLLVVWTWAAFGEEISYRGYLLNRGLQAMGGSAAAAALAVAATSVLFGFGHFYKGPAGILDSGVAGLVLCGGYFLAGRNLWACVLAHGLIDTFGVVALLFGWDV